MMLVHDDELRVERSARGGGELFDSFSESCNGGSRDPSRRGFIEHNAHGRCPSPHALAARLQQHGAASRYEAKHKWFSRSVSSGTEFYRKLQQQQSSEPADAPEWHAPSKSDLSSQDATSPITFSFPEVGNFDVIQPRWAHGATAIGDRMYVYGGLAAADSPLDGLHVFRLAGYRWRSLATREIKAGAAPPPMWGHAMAAAEGKLWLAGGRIKGHRRGKLRLQSDAFCLDTETLAWSKLPRTKRGQPPPFAEGSLTDCGCHGVVAFGGNTGRHTATAAVHVLHTSGTWSKMSTSGESPEARSHHTAVWDGCDRLIVFGGSSAGNGPPVAPTVHVLHLAERTWLQPVECGGQAGPCARAQHNASIIGYGSRTMAVIGGISAEGKLLNDVWLLDVGNTWRWRQGVPGSARPTARQGASCALVAGARVALCGGLSAAGPLDTVVLLSLTPTPGKAAQAGANHDGKLFTSPQQNSFQKDFQSKSVSTRHQPFIRHRRLPSTPLCTSSSSCSRRPTEVSLSDKADRSVASLASRPHLNGDSAPEPTLQHMSAEALLEATQRLLAQERTTSAALRTQVADLQTLLSDKDRAADDALAALKAEAEADSRAAACQAHALRSQAESAASHIAELQAEMASAAAAASEKLRETLAASAAREDAAVRAATGARGQAAALMRRCQDLSRRLLHMRQAHINSSASAKPRPPLARQSTFPLGHLQLAHIDEEGAGDHADIKQLSDSRTTQERPAEDAHTASVGSMSLHGAVDAAAAEEALAVAFSRWCGLHDIEQQSASEPASPRPSSPGALMDSLSGHAFPDRPRSAPATTSQHRDRSSISRVGSFTGSRDSSSHSSLPAMTASAMAERIRSLEVQVACLQGCPGALAACNPEQLQQLHRLLSAACAAVRRAAAIGEDDKPPACPLCSELPLQVVFNCGHQVCEECSLLKCPILCPFCHQTIAARIPLATR